MLIKLWRKKLHEYDTDVKQEYESYSEEDN